jgi:hypothetical protein
MKPKHQKRRTRPAKGLPTPAALRRGAVRLKRRHYPKLEIREVSR